MLTCKIEPLFSPFGVTFMLGVFSCGNAKKESHNNVTLFFLWYHQESNYSSKWLNIFDL